MNNLDFEDECAVLHGKKLSLEVSIRALERQFAVLKESDTSYRLHSASLDRKLKSYISDKGLIDLELAEILLKSDFNLPTKFLKSVSGATGFGRTHYGLNTSYLRHNKEMQRMISGYDRRSQNICVSIVHTNDSIALLNSKFGASNLRKTSESKTLAGLKIQYIQVSQELATKELANHKISKSGIGVSRTRHPNDTRHQERISHIVKRLFQ